MVIYNIVPFPIEHLFYNQLQNRPIDDVFNMFEDIAVNNTENSVNSKNLTEVLTAHKNAIKRVLKFNDEESVFLLQLRFPRCSLFLLVASTARIYVMI